MNDRSPAGETVYPRDYETLRETILEQRSVLPKRIAQVAAYALDNPDEIAFGTTASIAASAGVQPSTLIRFAQHLGFDGFTSLQSVRSLDLLARTVDETTLDMLAWAETLYILAKRRSLPVASYLGYGFGKLHVRKPDHRVGIRAPVGDRRRHRRPVFAAGGRLPDAHVEIPQRAGT